MSFGNARTPLSTVVISISIVAMFLLVALMLLVPGHAQADEVTPKWVRGYVYDIDGLLLAGANVTVTVDGNARSEDTDSSGFYQVEFSPSEWTIGHEISIVAVKNGLVGTNSTTAVAGIPQDLYCQIPYEIPEHGSPLGLLIAGGLLGIVAIVALTMIRRKP